MKALESRPGCISSTLEVIGDKWTPLILRDLSISPRTFGEIEISLAGISPRTLSQRLRKLRNHDILTRFQYCQHPPRYRYQLTSKGRDLQKVLRGMAEWGNKYSSTSY